LVLQRQNHLQQKQVKDYHPSQHRNQFEQERRSAKIQGGQEALMSLPLLGELPQGENLVQEVPDPEQKARPLAQGDHQDIRQGAQRHQ